MDDANNDKQLAMLRGRQAESRAASYLTRTGMKLVKRNFRCKLGEIDLIMLDRGELVFVEVKYRSSQLFGNSLDYVSRQKQQKLRKAALFFLQRHPQYAARPFRFDVVGLSPPPAGCASESLQVDWVRNALELDW